MHQTLVEDSKTRQVEFLYWTFLTAHVYFNAVKLIFNIIEQMFIENALFI